ncbi:MAG: four helix bundle protein [Gemmatimonadales bacterium]
MRDHHSLYAWQEARVVAIGVIQLARSDWKPWASALFLQLQRSSLSVQLNIAEGYAYGATPTFRRHLTIAYGSAVETGELLDLAPDAQIVAADSINQLLTHNHRSQRLLLGMPFAAHASPPPPQPQPVAHQYEARYCVRGYQVPPVIGRLRHHPATPPGSPRPARSHTAP